MVYFVLNYPFFKFISTKFIFMDIVSITWFVLTVCAIFALYMPIIEWALHRYVMHKVFLGFRYPFNAHALIHHKEFKANETYQTDDAKKASLIPMAWWNGPVITLVASIPFGFVSFWYQSWFVWSASVIGIFLYYGVYEYIHWCMHLPCKQSTLLHLPVLGGLFRKLNGHHLLHHRYPNKNFNVVLPLADWLFGTLIYKADNSFAQATGEGVPSVQPEPEKEDSRL